MSLKIKKKSFKNAMKLTTNKQTNTHLSKRKVLISTKLLKFARRII